MESIILAMLTLFLLTFFSALVMLKRRIQAVTEDPTFFKYFKIYQSSAATSTTIEKMLQADRHYINLFELPTLFYITCLLCLVTKMQAPTIQVSVWMFVILRMFHLVIHLGKNSVKYRMRAFFAQWIPLIIIWLTLGFSLF